jgi:uncharacterized DUF497 family protein
MKITFDPAKRERTLLERGLDFCAAAEVFAGRVYEMEDNRRDYGEKRMMCFGYLSGRMVVVGYVQRGDARHVFSMRKANEREQKYYTPLLWY